MLPVKTVTKWRTCSRESADVSKTSSAKRRRKMRKSPRLSAKNSEDKAVTGLARHLSLCPHKLHTAPRPQDGPRLQASGQKGHLRPTEGTARHCHGYVAGAGSFRVGTDSVGSLLPPLSRARDRPLWPGRGQRAAASRGWGAGHPGRAQSAHSYGPAAADPESEPCGAAAGFLVPRKP